LIAKKFKILNDTHELRKVDTKNGDRKEYF